MITFEILWFSSEKSCAIRMRSHQAHRPSSFFPVPKGRYLATFVRSSCGESTSCEHVSTTYGPKPVQGFWRSQERKDISRGSGCAWISKPKLHDTHVSLISDLFKEHIHLHESSTASSAFFFFKFGTQCKSKTRDPRAGVLRMSGRTRFLLFFMLIGETAATCVDVG